VVGAVVVGEMEVSSATLLPHGARASQLLSERKFLRYAEPMRGLLCMRADVHSDTITNRLITSRYNQVREPVG
jgi:hypothetical protein